MQGQASSHTFWAQLSRKRTAPGSINLWATNGLWRSKKRRLLNLCKPRATNDYSSPNDETRCRPCRRRRRIRTRHGRQKARRSRITHHASRSIHEPAPPLSRWSGSADKVFRLTSAHCILPRAGVDSCLCRNHRPGRYGTLQSAKRILSQLLHLLGANGGILENSCVSWWLPRGRGAAD